MTNVVVFVATNVLLSRRKHHQHKCMSVHTPVADPTLDSIPTPVDPLISMSVELPESVLTKLERHVSAANGVDINDVLIQAVEQYINAQ